MRFTLSILALAALAAPAVVSAQAGNETVTVRIDVKDIDFATAKGRAQFEKRIDARLRKACTVEANSRYRYGHDIVDQKCFADARVAALVAAERVAAARARSSNQIAAN